MDDVSCRGLKVEKSCSLGDSRDTLYSFVQTRLLYGRIWFSRNAYIHTYRLTDSQWQTVRETDRRHYDANACSTIG